MVSRVEVNLARLGDSPQLKIFVIVIYFSYIYEHLRFRNHSFP